MTRLVAVALLAGLLNVSAAPQSGVAARYRSEALMRRAAELHGVEVPPGVEVCASPTLPLGTRITVRSLSRRASWRCVIGDVAHPRDRASILRKGIVVEITPRGAMVLCGSVREPPSQCRVSVEVRP